MRTCSVDNCELPMAARGLCSPHYHKARKSKTLPERVKAVNAGPCIIPACENEQFCRNLCSTHYDRWLDGRDLTGPVVSKTAKGDPCVVEGCAKVGDRRGLCGMHYERLRKNGSVGPVGRLQREHGAGTPNEHGYLRVVVSGKRQMVHRRIVEQAIGRPLLPEETVHHISPKPGTKLDNRYPENLEIWSGRHGKGHRAEDHIAFAIETLRLYPWLLADAGYRLMPLESAEASEFLISSEMWNFGRTRGLRCG